MVSMCCLGNPSVVGVIFLCPYVLSLDMSFFPLCVEDYVVFVLLLSLLPFLFFPAMKALPFFPF